MTSLNQQERTPRQTPNRQIKVGKWNESLRASDVNQIWIELHRIVSSHPLVRASKQAGFLVEEGKPVKQGDVIAELDTSELGAQMEQARGTADAASSLFTVIRTSCDPARASAATCSAVPRGSAVSVFVIDWTTMG